MASLIGTEPNQAPTNGDLGTAAFQDAEQYHPNGLTLQSGAAAPTTADIQPGYVQVWKNTSENSRTMWANDNGTIVPVGPALGGATPSGSVTLNSASSGAQAVTPTGYGQGATLPAANTCAEGALLFTIRNKGIYPYFVKDSAGTLLGWIPPRGCASVGLADNSTAAGDWTVTGVDLLGVSAATSVSVDGGLYDVVNLDANRSVVLFTATNVLYAMAVDYSTGSFGAAVVVRTGVTLGFVQAVATATAGQVLVCSCSTTTAFEAVTLSVTGTSIVVNAAVTATLATALTIQKSGLVALGTNYVVAYQRGTAGACLRNITISGTVPAISAETAVTPVVNINGVSTGTSTVGMLFANSGTTNYAIPFSVSAGVPVQGTAATWTGGVGANGVQAARNFGSRWLTLNETTQALVSLSGTTATVSTFSGGIGASDVSNGFVADGQISATKWLQARIVSTAQIDVRIVTDSSGTASVGSLSVTGDFANGGIVIGKLSATRATIYAKETSGAVRVVELDVSGATPSMLKQSTFSATTAPALPAPGTSYAGAVATSGFGNHSQTSFRNAH